MADYCTRDDLRTRFGEVELRQIAAGDSGRGTDEARITRALADAAAEIDTYLGTRYPVPLASVPDVISRLAADIARYRLYDQAAPDEIRGRYEDAVGVLTRIASGAIKLGALEAPAGAATSTAARIVSDERVMTRDGLKGLY